MLTLDALVLQSEENLKESSMDVQKITQAMMLSQQSASERLNNETQVKNTLKNPPLQKTLTELLSDDIPQYDSDEKIEDIESSRLDLSNPAGLMDTF